MRSIWALFLVAGAAASVSCGGEFKAGSGGAGGSGGTSGSVNGGAEGSGQGGSAAKPGTGGSSAGSGGAGGSSGTGGTGGAGEVVDKSCATDADCALGYRAGLCCGDCLRAMSRAFVNAQPCYCARGETCGDPTCQEAPCPSGCPAIGCAPVSGVTCQVGECTEVYNSGSGGTGGTGGTGGAGGTGGGGGACADLIAEYDAVLIEARKCSAGLTVEQCTGQTTVPDRCGCPVLLNDTSPAASEAQYYYQQWVQAGCGPHACGAPCLGGTAGVCKPNVTGGASCQWGF